MDNIEIYKGKVTCMGCGGNSIDERVETDSQGMTDICAYRVKKEGKDKYVARCSRCNSIITCESYEEIEDSTSFYFDCP